MWVRKEVKASVLSNRMEKGITYQGITTVGRGDGWGWVGAGIWVGESGSVLDVCSLGRLTAAGQIALK